MSLQVLLGAHRGFAEDGADVEHAQSAHFEKILQQLRAAAFQGFGRNVIELDHVVGDQSAAARDQLQRQLALAHPALAGDQHAHSQHVQEYAVAGDELRKRAPEIGAHHPDDLQAVQGRGQQRDIARSREFGERGRRFFLLAENDAHQAAAGEAGEGLALVAFAKRGEIGGFGAAEDLDPVGMDQIQVADQSLGSLVDLAAVEIRRGFARPGNPRELERIGIVLKQLRDADLGHEAPIC